jgi:hypothetical protein
MKLSVQPKKLVRRRVIHEFEMLNHDRSTNGLLQNTPLAAAP